MLINCSCCKRGTGFCAETSYGKGKLRNVIAKKGWSHGPSLSFLENN
jgi:hypothetical protein